MFPLKEFRISKRALAFRAGFMACLFLLLYASHLALNHFRPELQKKAFAVGKEWVNETFFEEALFKEPIFVTQYYSDSRDGHKYQVWKLTLSGRASLHGEIEDQATGNKGVIKGYWRANTLTLTYGSASPDRPGFGTFVLRPLHPGQADQSVAYAGLALVHECECKDGSVITNGQMLLVPAVMTKERQVPTAVAAAFFTKSPVKPNIVWPADIQKIASSKN